MDAITKSFEAAERCDTMLVIGTSAVVVPAAYLPFGAKNNGADIIEFNRDETPLDTIASVSVIGAAKDTVPAVVNKVLEIINENKAQ